MNYQDASVPGSRLCCHRKLWGFRLVWPALGQVSAHVSIAVALAGAESGCKLYIFINYL